MTLPAKLIYATQNSSSFSTLWLFFFFNDTATTEIYTLSLHDALPLSVAERTGQRGDPLGRGRQGVDRNPPLQLQHAFDVGEEGVRLGKRQGHAVLEQPRRCQRLQRLQRVRPSDLRMGEPG